MRNLCSGDFFLSFSVRKGILLSMAFPVDQETTEAHPGKSRVLGLGQPLFV